MNLSRRTVLTAISAAAAAQAQRQRPPNWKPKLGVLCGYSDANLEFVKAEGFTSMQLRLDPDKLDDAAIGALKDKIQRAGIYVSSLAVDGNHIDPDPAKRDHQNQYTAKCIELCGKMGIPNIGGQSGTIKGRPLQEQVDEIVRVYSEKYFPVLEKNKVRILWEPYAGGPNIATGPVGWEALFKAFNNSPNVGLQFDPSHLVWQFMDPVAAAREFSDKIYDVHLKVGALRDRLHGCDEHRERRRVLLSGVRAGQFHRTIQARVPGGARVLEDAGATVDGVRMFAPRRTLPCRLRVAGNFMRRADVELPRVRRSIRTRVGLAQC